MLSRYFGSRVLYSLPVGLLVGAIQDVAPPHLRGQTAAIYYLAIGVVGVTLGPLLVALLTDHVFQRPEEVGKSLATLIVILAPSAALLMTIGRRAFRLALTEQLAAAG
jgi:MFS family permease